MWKEGGNSLFFFLVREKHGVFEHEMGYLWEEEGRWGT